MADHVRAIQTHCGFRLDYVLANKGNGISQAVLERYRSEAAQPVESQWVVTDESQVVLFESTPQQMTMVEGAILVEDSLADERLEADERSGERLVLLYVTQGDSAILNSPGQRLAVRAEIHASDCPSLGFTCQR